MSRTKRYIGGASFGYLNQFLVTAAGLWLTPFLLGRLGQKDYGLWLVGTQVLAYLLLADFGVVALLPREVAAARGRGAAPGGGARHPAELSAVVGDSARLVLWQTPLVAAAALAVWLLMPAEWEPLHRPLAFVLAVFVLTFPLRLPGAVLQGLQDWEFLSKTQTCVWLAGTLVTVALAAAGAGLYALAWGWAVAQGLSAAVMLLRLARRVPGALKLFLPRAAPDARAAGGVRAKLASGFWVSLNQIAVALLVGTDVLIIGRVLGPEAVVPFACTGKLVAVLANQPQMLMQLAVPALSELRAGGAREHLSTVCVALAQMMLLVSGAVVCVVLAANGGFVTWWVGARQYGGFGVTAAVVLAMLLRHFNLTVGYVLFAFGHERRLAVTALADGLTTVAAAALLMPYCGIIGAPLGSALGASLISLPSNLAALSRSGAVTVGGLARALSPWFFRFSALALAASALALGAGPRTLAGFGAAALAVALVYGVVMLPIALRQPLGTYLRPRLSALGRAGWRALRWRGGEA